MQRLLFTIPVALVLTWSADIALAQNKVDGQTAQELKSDENVFVNGVLTVPGAPADVDTAPAKFSARTAADDRVAIVGYRLRHLTKEQKRVITQELSSQRDAMSGDTAPNDSYAVVGAEVPAPVALQALVPMPKSVTAQFPELKGATFMRAPGKLLIVDPDNSLVIGVLDI